MNPRPPALSRALVLLLAAAATLEAALTTGGSAYTKRLTTTLLAGPSATAAPAGTLAFGRKLKVEEIKGAWLRVSDGAATGWVFAGNISETKPAEGKGLDGLGLAASQTTATAAARPLTPAGIEYAARNNLVPARADLDWLLAQSTTVTNEEVERFLQDGKRGEYK